MIDKDIYKDSKPINDNGNIWDDEDEIETLPTSSGSRP
jgi:hypothetical protein